MSKCRKDHVHVWEETMWGVCRVDTELNCIKGGGACQLREKVLAEAAKTFVCLFIIAEPVLNSPQVHRRCRLPKKLGHLRHQRGF
jgi:ribose 5-phosphate isomerase